MGRQLILLNGTPSAGKTTLARALHEAYPEPAFHLDLDTFMRRVQHRYWMEGDFSILFQQVVDAYLSMLRSVVESGLVAIAESVITPLTKPKHDVLFGDVDLLFVGVRCPLAVVQAREASRGDRLRGPHEVTQADIDLVHEVGGYDLEVDTSVEPTADSVKRILERCR